MSTVKRKCPIHSEHARQMVETARATGKLLQIGHQRRSNPKYRFCYDELIKKGQHPGPCHHHRTTVSGIAPAVPARTWVGLTARDWTRPRSIAMVFRDMKQFRNWRWYKGLGGGPIVDLGSHQIDIYSWFLEAQPTFGCG